ncbi:hypothetical protein SLS53_006421 [Cytospora paraplurivora]|uniref:Uncharacterized protein n=1 Tax=Cytospora paraplurivora TaxID=2898453 RepID=A0AAN9YF53_9PEZI
MSQPQPRLAPIPVSALHQANPGGRPTSTPMMLQQRPAPQHILPQMQRPMPPADAFPPHPPREIIPPQLHRSVVVSDIRPEIQTEEDIREHLSDYIIFRFDKVEPHDEYDFEGGEVKATWDNCIRTRVAGVDKADAQREIRRLNREDAKKGRTFMEKQNSLGPKGQDQLSKAQRELSLEDSDDRFHTVLAQFDSRLKPVIEKYEKVTRHRSNTKRKVRQRKRYERTSITAYFRRCPRPNHLPSELARRIELEKQQFRQQQEQQRMEMAQPRPNQVQVQQTPPQRPRAMPHPHPGPMPNPQVGHMTRPGSMPPHPQAMPMNLPQQMPPHQQAMPMNRLGQAPPIPQSAPMNRPGSLPHPQAAPMNRAQPMAMRQPSSGHGASRSHTPVQVIHKPSERGKHHRKGHSRGSDSSSEYSDSTSGSEVSSESTLVTVPTRSSDSYKSRKEHDRKRKSVRYLEKPKNFGVDVRPARRHGLGEDPPYILTRSGTRIAIVQAPTPPREAAIPAENLEQLQADAYRAGRNDQKAEDRQRLAEAASLDTAARRCQPKLAPRPDIILDRGSPRIRHVTPSEVNRQLDDSFQRLRLGRDPRYHDELHELNHRDEQRRREAVAREEQELIMREFEEQEVRERRKRDSTPPLLNPFSPLSRRRTNDLEADYRR